MQRTAMSSSHTRNEGDYHLMNIQGPQAEPIARPEPNVVIYERYEINRLRGWLVYQLKTLNLSNVVLLITVAILSRNIAQQSRELDQKATEIATLNANINDGATQIRALLPRLDSINNTVNTLQLTMASLNSNNTMLAWGQNMQVTASVQTAVTWGAGKQNEQMKVSSGHLWLTQGTYLVQFVASLDRATGEVAIAMGLDHPSATYHVYSAGPLVMTYMLDIPTTGITDFFLRTDHDAFITNPSLVLTRLVA